MDELIEGAKNFGIELNLTQKAQFSTFLDELKLWNERTNLTAIREDDDIIKKHFLDSLSVLSAIPKNTQTVIDVGTGAGFPGLPIAIAEPNISVTLLESSDKKVEFLKHIVSKLELKNVIVLSGRAEDGGKNLSHREKYDVATARAVANLATLAEYLLPFIRIGGKMIAQKSAETPEIDGAKNAIEILGGGNLQIIPIIIRDLEPRNLIVIEKIKSTPSEYPRRIGVPSKKPL